MKQGVHFSRDADGRLDLDGVMLRASPYGATEFGWRHAATEALRAKGIDGVMREIAHSGRENGWWHGIQAALQGGGRVGGSGPY